VGYTALLVAAALAFYVITTASCGWAAVTEAQLAACVDLIADTTELIMQPRAHEECCLGEEGRFVDSLRKVVTRDGTFAMPQGPARARLVDCWQRLERSDALEARADAIMVNQAFTTVTASARAAAAAAPGLRGCGLAGCGAREQHPSHFKCCSACRRAAYCCKEHQAEDWPAHKAACKAARRAAASDSATD
jgi:hypothetical protein